MLISLLFSLTLSAPAPQAPATTGPQQAVNVTKVRGQARAASRGWQAPPIPQRGIYGERLRGTGGRVRGGGGRISSVLGGAFTPVGNPGASVTAVPAPNVTQLTFTDPGTGWQESCLVGVPGSPLPNAPLLVMFHSYGVTEWDCYLNTNIFQLALERGWYVIAPLSAHKYNFGIAYSQVNTEYVIDWMMATFPVDPSRVYGVGFSMGGGGVMSYMARHLDPAHARFAAVVNHTGGTSIANTYWNSSDTSLLDDQAMFGGSPATKPFEYSQASVVDIDFSTSAVDPATDLARNAAHVPILNFTATQDPLAYLLVQMVALQTWMEAFSGVVTRLEAIDTIHDWSTLDIYTTLDFLEQHTLQVPRAGTHRILADREAQWQHFYVYQDVPGAFTPFRWTMLDWLNRIVIDQTENLQRIVINSASIGLDTSSVTEVMFGTQDGSAEEITLTGYAIQPLSVVRNGQATNSWSWDAVTQSVTLSEVNSAAYPLWKITP